MFHTFGQRKMVLCYIKSRCFQVSMNLMKTNMYDALTFLFVVVPMIFFQEKS